MSILLFILINDMILDILLSSSTQYGFYPIDWIYDVDTETEDGVKLIQEMYMTNQFNGWTHFTNSDKLCQLQIQYGSRTPEFIIEQINERK